MQKYRGMMHILFITSEKNFHGGKNLIYRSLSDSFTNARKNDIVEHANFGNYHLMLEPGIKPYFDPQAIYIDFNGCADLKTAKEVIADATQFPPVRTVFAINCTPEQEAAARSRSVIVAGRNDQQHVLETLHRINHF